MRQVEKDKEKKDSEKSYRKTQKCAKYDIVKDKEKGIEWYRATHIKRHK